MPERAAGEAQHHRLDEELPQDVAAAAPTAIRRPISRVRSVTDTSMMFMMPDAADDQRDQRHGQQQAASSASTVAARALRHLGHVADVEVVRLAGPDAVPLAQQLA